MMANEFKLAPMDGLIKAITVFMLGLLCLFIVFAITGSRFLAIPAACLLVIYLWIWLRFRPTSFIVDDNAITVEWPMKSRLIARSDILQTKLVSRAELRNETGWALRFGAGGLWGGFGWLWTKKRGIVQMYISRIDNIVWIELADGRPWLITPERPDKFVRALSR
ncbi:MAG: PH domain-containing protein [Pyrinomonadaceae bacterium]